MYLSEVSSSEGWDSSVLLLKSVLVFKALVPVMHENQAGGDADASDGDGCKEFESVAAA